LALRVPEVDREDDTANVLLSVVAPDTDSVPSREVLPLTDREGATSAPVTTPDTVRFP
jgi:hypothetical protein